MGVRSPNNNALLFQGEQSDSTVVFSVDYDGNVATSGTVDGVDIAARDAVLTSTTTTANAALPKAGGTMTGALAMGANAITTSSTVDGVDIAARDAILTSTTTTANAALPKSGGAMTGAITTNSTFDGRDVATDGAKLDYITVTQAVSLDQMEIDIAALANGMVYKGDWSAASGSFPGSGAAQTGWFYYVSGAGTVNGITFAIGDNIIATTDNASATTYSGNWSKHDQTDAVTSVVGLNGSITKSALLSALNVEDGATADQTAAQILTAIKTVDGAGSGLDADLLDGLSSASFATSAQGTLATNALPKAGGTMTGDLSFGDNDKAIFGAGSDLSIYHSGAQSFISDQGTGPLIVLASGLDINNAANTENMLTAYEDGAVTLYNNGAAKLATTSTGVT
jgi:hypothetical protein